MRQFVEALTCLALVVMLFRTFQVEGYMISTGSMAPCLLGYHKRIVCPSCGYSFAVGVSFDTDDGIPAGDAKPKGWHSTPARCPNCGQGSIDVSHTARNEGDQLLVHRAAYLYRTPRRWEIVVFRNPAMPTEAYVKRVVGLPNESIQIADGDVYANGVLQRKSLAQQHSVRIPVYDHDFHPSDDPSWRSRWIAESQMPAWRTTGDGFTLDAAGTNADDGPQDWSWLRYRHWIRSGGTHLTSVPLAYTVEPLELSRDTMSPLRFNADSRELYCFGGLSASAFSRLMSKATIPELQDGIERLYEQSHYAPVTDAYGYNRPACTGSPAFLRDLMFSVRVDVSAGTGAYRLEMTDGRHVFDCTFDLGRNEVWLNVDKDPHPVRRAILPQAVLEGPVLVEMSLMDQQVLVAVEGQTLLAPWTYSLRGESCYPRACPVRFGARGVNACIDSLKLYRDVYYTEDQFPNGLAAPVQLNDQELYVLGDNSPVSRDSRSWDHPAVPLENLLGRPFLVHLPSQRREVRFMGSVYYIRIPDISRIRYIH